MKEKVRNPNSSLILYPLSLILSTTLLFAGFTDDVGGFPGMLLNYGGSPRTLSMGKAFTGLANDAEAGYFNPAGLVQLNEQNVKLSHDMLYADCNMEFLAYAMPTRNTGTFGLTLLGIWAKDIEARTPDNQRAAIGWGYYETSLLFSYAYSPLSWLGMGANLKLATKNVNFQNGVAAGLDAGLIFLGPKPLQFGIFGQNLLSSGMKNFPGETYPMTLRAGAAARFFNDRIAVDADIVKVGLIDRTTGGLDTTVAFEPHGGLEFEVVPGILTPRVGIDNNEISVGLGVKQLWGAFGIGIDYAYMMHYASDYNLEATHKVGINIEFGGYRTWIAATPALFSPTPGDRQNVLMMDVKTMSRQPIKRWQILIKNDLGEVVRTFGAMEPPPMRLEWDGLDDAGRLVTDGTYSYQVVLIDERNQSLAHEAFLTRIRTKGPTGKIEIEKKD